MDKWKQIAGLFAVCTVMTATPFSASAATINNATLLQHGPGSETAQYLVKVTADSAVISTDVDGENLLLTADKDDEFPLLEKSDEDGWLKVQVGDEEGYLLDESSASLEEAEEEELETAAAAAGGEPQSGEAEGGRAGSCGCGGQQAAGSGPVRHAVFRVQIP